MYARVVCVPCYQPYCFLTGMHSGRYHSVHMKRECATSDSQGQYICDADAYEGIRYRLEWILPTALVSATPMELPAGTKEVDPTLLGHQIREVQRLIEAESQMLAASYKLSNSSGLKKSSSLRKEKGGMKSYASSLSLSLCVCFILFFCFSILLCHVFHIVQGHSACIFFYIYALVPLFSD